MITYYQLPGGLGLPSLSPFCIKLETYLRLAKVGHTTKNGDMRKAPRGKMPYIRREDGQLMGDSALVIDYLKEAMGDPLDADLTDAQRAHGHLLRRTCEESFYWTLVYSRWMDDAGWRTLVPLLKSFVPAPLRPILPGVMRKAVEKSLHGHGYGRHDPETIYAFGCADVDALAATLGEKPFMLGETPTSYDCSAYGMLWPAAIAEHPNPITARVRAHQKLVDYVNRVKEAAGYP